MPERDRDDLANLVAQLNGGGLCALPPRNAETVKNYPRGVGAIECVKMNAGHVVIQKIVTLFQSEVNADAETAAIRMRARFVESANELNQIDRMLERIARFIVGDVARPIAPEREDISNRRPGVAK